MGRRRQREVERAGGRADEPRDGHRDDVTQDQLRTGEGHRLLGAIPRNGDHHPGESKLTARHLRVVPVAKAQHQELLYRCHCSLGSNLPMSIHLKA